METRKMTWKLAEALMDNLCCVAISAEGGYREDMSLEDAQQYAREKFVEILGEWEKTYGFEWNIEEPSVNERKFA